MGVLSLPFAGFVPAFSAPSCLFEGVGGVKREGLVGDDAA